MKKFLSMVLALTMVFSMSVPAFAADFKDTIDVPQSEAIDVIETLGVVNGYGNDIYGPNDILNRAQLCTMLTRAIYGSPIYTSTVHFDDVDPNHWASAYINTAYAYGLMQGYGNNKFGPDDKITYTQMVAVIMKALGYDCSKMKWPTGINVMGHTLNLFENVQFENYSDGCTRAHAAQMIYNAFDLNYVNHMADYPVAIKTKTFLADGLGFKETVVTVEGHEYVAYTNLATGKTLTTNNCLTYEATIYPLGGYNYRLANSFKSYAIDWYWLTNSTENDVVLYVNGVLITSGSEELFADCESATGIFDADDNLIAIHMESTGTDFVYDILPDAEIYDIVKNDKRFNEKTSTVTYFPETGDYIISNMVEYGWVTDAYKSAIYVDGVRVYWENTSNVIEKGDFVKVFFNYRDEVVAIVATDADNAYIYDVTAGVYHTHECDVWGDYVNHHYHTSIEEIKDCDECNKATYEFEACPHCHAKSGAKHNGKDITIVK